MSLITFSALRAEIIAEAFPEGESSKHMASHTRALKAGLILMQDSLHECLLERQIEVFPQDETFFNNNMTLVQLTNDLRRGTISRVYTIANGVFSDFVDYYDRPKDVVEHWAHNLVLQPEDHAPASDLTFGYGTFNPSASWDSSCGRARQGAYYKEGGKLWIVPFIQSYESLVIEYKGEKRAWADADLLDDEIWSLERVGALIKYVVYQHESDFGCDREKLITAREAWEMALADCMFECTQEANGRADKPRYLDRPLSADEATNDAVTDTTTVEFMAVGDLGDADDVANSEQVAQLINQFQHDYLLLLGDINYDGGTPESFDFVLKRFYGGRLDKILPVWGNHDLEFEFNGQYGGAMLELFPHIAALNSSKLYYNKVVGPVEFFVINSGYSDAEPREPDGITSGGTQGAWLQAKLAASTATWKIVMLHRAPYTDDDSYDPGITSMRWPFITWGADFVLSGHGHNYQHLLASSLNYFVVGTGGAPLRDFASSRSTESQFQHKAFGAQRIIATSSRIQFIFYDIAGDVIDNKAWDA